MIDNRPAFSTVASVVGHVLLRTCRDLSSCSLAVSKKELPYCVAHRFSNEDGTDLQERRRGVPRLSGGIPREILPAQRVGARMKGTGIPSYEGMTCLGHVRNGGPVPPADLLPSGISHTSGHKNGRTCKQIGFVRIVGHVLLRTCRDMSSCSLAVSEKELPYGDVMNSGGQERIPDRTIIRPAISMVGPTN